MFDTYLSGNIPFIDSSSEKYLANITGSDYRSDRTMTSTLRAFLHSRIDVLNLKEIHNFVRFHGVASLRDAQYPVNINEFLRTAEPKDLAGIFQLEQYIKFQREDINYPTIQIFDARRGSYIDEITDAFYKSFDYLLEKDYTENLALNQFCNQKKVKLRAFIDKQGKGSIVIYDKVDYKGWHLIQSLIPVLLPTFFRDREVDSDELELLLSLQGTNVETFVSALRKLSLKCDLRKQYLEKALKGFDRRHINQTINSIQRNITNIDADINSYNDSISNLYRQREELLERLLGLESKRNDKDDTEGDETVEFLRHNKCITLEDLDEGRMTVRIRTYLDNFNVDLFEKIYENKKSVIWNFANYGLRGDARNDMRVVDIPIVFKAMFDTGSIKLRMSTAISLDFDYAERSYYRSEDEDGWVQNPHLKYCNCFGNNSPLIVEALRERDSVSALSQCISVVGNINLSESMNICNLVSDMLNNKGTIFERTNDKKLMTFDEAVKWLKGETNE